MGTDPLVLVWLVVLTLGTVSTLVGVVLLNQRFRNLPSLREMDLADKMDRVIQVANSQTVMRNEAIRRNVIILIRSIEADPLAAEKFHTQLVVLKDSLAA